MARLAQVVSVIIAVVMVLALVARSYFSRRKEKIDDQKLQARLDVRLASLADEQKPQPPTPPTPK
jgi:hypothetical protein